MPGLDSADQVAEVADNHPPLTDAAKARFQRWTALLIAVSAVLLALNSLGGSNAAEDALNANILASDAWAFYQAKNVRQTMYKLAVDDLTTRLKGGGRDVDAGEPASLAGPHRRLPSYHRPL